MLTFYIFLSYLHHHRDDYRQETILKYILKEKLKDSNVLELN